MFEHIVNSVYIPSHDVISHRLDAFEGLLSGQFECIKSKLRRQRVEQSQVQPIDQIARCSFPTLA